MDDKRAKKGVLAIIEMTKAIPLNLKRWKVKGKIPG